MAMVSEYVALSVFTSFCGVAVAVNALEVFRVERELYRRPVWRSAGVYLFSVNIGVVSVWLMHFVGMAAVTKPAATWYDPKTTGVSAVLGVIGFVLGALVASTDPFFGKHRVEAMNVVASRTRGRANHAGLMTSKRALKVLLTVEGTQRIFAGAFISAGGITSMHFVGLSSARNVVFATDTARVVSMFCLAAAVCAVGFWVAFRLLQWMPRNETLRTASYVPLTLAICAAHYSACTVVEPPHALPAEVTETLASGADIILLGYVWGVAQLLFSCVLMMALIRAQSFTRLERVSASHQQHINDGGGGTTVTPSSAMPPPATDYLPTYAGGSRAVPHQTSVAK